MSEMSNLKKFTSRIGRSLQTDTLRSEMLESDNEGDKLSQPRFGIIFTHSRLRTSIIRYVTIFV